MVLNDARRITILNVGIFGVILALAILILTTEREIPGVPDLSPFEAVEIASRPVVTNTTTRQRYPDFGEARIFDTLVPRPTPSPTPLPTPVPDPRLADALLEYKIVGILPRMGIFRHDRADANTPDIQIKVGETYTIRHRNQEMVIRLESTDIRRFTATFSYSGRQGVQTHTLTLSDQR